VLERPRLLEALQQENAAPEAEGSRPLAVELGVAIGQQHQPDVPFFQPGFKAGQLGCNGAAKSAVETPMDEQNALAAKILQPHPSTPEIRELEGREIGSKLRAKLPRGGNTGLTASHPPGQGENLIFAPRYGRCYSSFRIQKVSYWRPLILERPGCCLVLPQQDRTLQANLGRPLAV
jgi:hypothetical protein